MDSLQNDSLQLAFSVLWPLIQQRMTGSNLPIFRWIRPESSTKLKIAVSAIAAALGTAGFHLSHAGSALAGSQWTLSIPPLTVIVHMALALGVQQLVYRLAVKPK
jgi:hypothetical protein